jgi:drug/metabolite transporter (DMT)-like permease
LFALATIPAMPSSRALGYVLLFSGMALVGTYVALSKPLTAEIPVFLLASLRFGIAAIVMLPWLRPSPTDAALDAPILRTLFVQSFFGNFLFSITMLFGVSMTTASSAGVILSTLPAVVAILSWLFLRERLDRRVWLAIGLAIAGISALTILRSAETYGGAGPPGVAGTHGGGATPGDSLIGNLLIFACVWCEATYVILGKKLTPLLSAKRISALINVIGLALMLPFGLWQARSFDFSALSANTWLLLIFYAVSASMISTWLWLSGLKSVPASHSGVFTIALPLAACVVGVVWLNEVFSLAHALAFVCASAGLVLIATAKH